MSFALTCVHILACVQGGYPHVLRIPGSGRAGRDVSGRSGGRRGTDPLTHPAHRRPGNGALAMALRRTARLRLTHVVAQPSVDSVRLCAAAAQAKDRRRGPVERPSPYREVLRDREGDGTRSAEWDRPVREFLQRDDRCEALSSPRPGALGQTGLYAFVVEPWAPYLSAFLRVSSNFERMYVFTRFPCSIRSKPCLSSVVTYSASSRAPAIQPVQRSILRRPSSDTGCWIVTSAIWIRPPGTSTR